MKKRVLCAALALALILILAACGGGKQPGGDEPQTGGETGQTGQTDPQGLTLRVRNGLTEPVYRVAIEYPGAGGALGSLAATPAGGGAYAAGELFTFDLAPESVAGLSSMNFTIYAYGEDGRLLYTAKSADWDIAPGMGYDFGFALDPTTGAAGLSRDIVGR